ncbi:MAG: hypothetical protein AAF511_05570 [Pseudomonadota bacterium]
MFGVKLPGWLHDNAWSYYVLAVFVAMLGSSIVLFMEIEKAERAEAMRIGAPAIVDIQDFDREKHTGPAREVYVRGQVDPSMNRELTKTEDGEIKNHAQMIPLYAVNATSFAVAPDAVLFENIYKSDSNPIGFNEMLEKRTMGQGPIGPIIEVNGLLETGTTASSMVSDAFMNANRTYDSNATLIDPFLGPREEELQLEYDPYLILPVFLGLSALLLIYGNYVRRRSTTERKAAQSPKP